MRIPTSSRTTLRGLSLSGYVEHALIKTDLGLFNYPDCILIVVSMCKSLTEARKSLLTIGWFKSVLSRV